MFETGEKEKWNNKGMNKQQQPDSGHELNIISPSSGIYDTFTNCPYLY